MAPPFFSQCTHIADLAVGVSAVVAGVVEFWTDAAELQASLRNSRFGSGLCWLVVGGWDLGSGEPRSVLQLGNWATGQLGPACRLQMSSVCGRAVNYKRLDIFAWVRLASHRFVFISRCRLHYDLCKIVNASDGQHAPAARHEISAQTNQLLLLIAPCSSAAIAIGIVIEIRSFTSNQLIQLAENGNYIHIVHMYIYLHWMGVFSVLRFYSKRFEANRKAAPSHWPSINQERHVKSALVKVLKLIMLNVCPGFTICPEPWGATTVATGCPR